MSEILNQDQVDAYHRDGFLVVRNPFREEDLARLDRGVLRAVKAGKPDDDPSAYPVHGVQHTINGQFQDDPDLLFIGEHPIIVQAGSALLGSPVYLSAFVSFLKTPGAKGTIGDYQGSAQGSGRPSSAHCDYKTYHQAGSSLDWIFTIVPLVDLDEETGPLLVASGSHKFSRVVKDVAIGPVHPVHRARFDQVGDLVNPELRRGDLLFMNMFTWHEGFPNQSGHDRYGIFNKYRARHAPPACGPTLFSEEARNVFSKNGQQLLPHYGNGRVNLARLLLECNGEVFLVQENGSWQLPGGAIETDPESPSPDNVIEQLTQFIEKKLRFEAPWMTYIDDYHKAGRVYAYPLSDSSANIDSENEGSWFSYEAILNGPHSNGKIPVYVTEAVKNWRDPKILRGMGESMARAKKKDS